MSGLLISIVFNFVFFLIILGFSILLLLIKKHTPVLAMYKAKMKGIPLCLFFNDDKTFEMRPIQPDNNCIEDKKFGTYIINEEGSYIDKTNKFVVLPFSSSVGITVPSKFAKVSDALKKVFGDEREISKFRQNLMNGTLERVSNDLFLKHFEKKVKDDPKLSPDEKIKLLMEARNQKFKDLDVLRESINYSSIKSMVNSFTPQNINSKINMTISRKMAVFGDSAMKFMVILLIAGMFIIGVLGFILYMFANSPETVAPVIREVVTNSSVLG
jgi:hypothetical protein